MTRENLLFAIIGILLGFIVGFMFASSMSQKHAAQQAAGGSQTMPADHPPRWRAKYVQIRRQCASRSLLRSRRHATNRTISKRRSKRLSSTTRSSATIRRSSILLKANQLKPTDYRTVVILGMVNLDAGHYDTAEKWYRAAMKMKQDDVMVLAGLAAVTLEKGDAKAAEDAIAQVGESGSEQRGSAAVPG